MKKAKKDKTIRALSVDLLVPNTWNPNEMAKPLFKKLKRNLKRLKDAGLPVPSHPTVRPHPEIPGKFEIINGEHRWRAHRELRDEGDTRFEKILCVVGDYDDATAMSLTIELNELHGETNIDKQGALFGRMHTEYKMSPEEMSESLPYTADEVTTYLEAYDIEVTHISVDPETSEILPKDTAERETLMEIRAVVYSSQADVIETEVNRIASILTGKNMRGRAFEIMAVHSSQTPLESMMVLAEDEEVAKPSKKSKKDRLREKTKKRKEVADE